MSNYGMRRDLKSSFDEALARVPEALKTEGFGVLTEIDVKETLQNKLGAHFRRYKILGACNPPLAYRALQTDLEVGLLLPCNVVVYERDDGKATAMAIDPLLTPAAQGSGALKQIAQEVHDKLTRVLERLA